MTRDELLAANAAFPYWVVKKMRAAEPLVRRLPEEDCCQAAWVAMCRAADLYDPSRGVRFCTYAYRAVANAVRTASRHAGVVSLPSCCEARRRGGPAFERAGATYASLARPDGWEENAGGPRHDDPPGREPDPADAASGRRRPTTSGRCWRCCPSGSGWCCGCGWRAGRCGRPARRSG